MSEQYKPELITVLAAPSYMDAKVDELACVAATRIWQAMLSCTKEPFSENEVQLIQDTLHTTLHWAVHIGQSAWQLLTSKRPSGRLRERSFEWRSAIEELYQRPFIMLDADDSFLMMLSKLQVRVLGIRASVYDSNEQIDSGFAFTLSRLSNDATQKCELTIDADSWHTAKALEDHLVRNAKLYVRNLEWLLYSKEQSSIATIDCFVSMCAIALSMSGDSLRMLWPIRW